MLENKLKYGIKVRDQIHNFPFRPMFMYCLIYMILISYDVHVCIVPFFDMTNMHLQYNNFWL